MFVLNKMTITFTDCSLNCRWLVSNYYLSFIVDHIKKILFCIPYKIFISGLIKP